MVASLCPSDTLPKDNICQSCHEGCVQCVDQIHYCTSCAPGYMVDTVINSTVSTCTNNCPLGTVNDTANVYGGGCTCSPQCQTCQNTLEQCLSCDAGSLFPLLSGSACVSSCPSGSYQETNSRGSE